MMKKFLLLAMTLLMALSLVAGCGSDGPKKMVIGLDDNFAPMGFRNEKNEIVGYDIDLAREACKRAGMEVEFNLSTGLPKKPRSRVNASMRSGTALRSILSVNRLILFPNLTWSMPSW